ncbi:hypothetical protein B0H10DRAFT_1964733 [Mycena sp. CBHHK59/15]|nr:hypothetical protein B0H10DRAFT_1964733 [Mycena sp. CBHHK59/15]
MADQPRFAEIHDALLEGVWSLQKWFHRTETTSSTYFICMVLDLTIKDTYFCSCWEPSHFKKAMKQLEQVFNQYYTAKPIDIEPQSSTITLVEPTPLHHYGSSFFLDAVKSAQKTQQAAAQSHEELKQYLSAQLEVTPNVLHCTGGALNIDLFEVLQSLKSMDYNGHISAGDIAAKHMGALIAELIEQGFGSKT